jgi:microcystin-dependent protein
MPATPILGEIIMAGFNFAPKGYALCNGQLLSIQQNAALFSILGTTYGGNGIQNFALPNLQGCTPVHFGVSPGGSNFTLGQVGGEVNHTLLINEMPAHVHTATATAATAATGSPTGAFWASGGQHVYAAPDGSGTMAPQALATAGNTQPHNNLQPYLVINFFIALQGIFPSRN